MPHAILTVDLGFGDAGKGTIVDYLTRAHQAHTVIRYNGGAQAAHRVVTDDATPREHVFAQFGSGTLAGANTHLSRFMLLDPLAMQAEEAHLRQLGVADAWARTTIDERALVITPFQRAANRLRELARGAGRHGSCGMGIGETVADHLAYGEHALFAGDLLRPAVLRAKLHFLRERNAAKVQALRATLPDDEHTAQELDMLAPDVVPWLVDMYGDFVQQARIVPGAHLHRVLREPGTTIFEAAQGVLLDEWRGFHPYTTWSTTTLANAERLLHEAGFAGTTRRIGITRAYATRHGAGPFVSEDAALAAALPDASNQYGAWQHGFRVGWLDLVLLRYACDVVGGLDELAVTCLDRLHALGTVQVCRRYMYNGDGVERLVPATAPDLAYQERLTRMVGQCHAALEPVPSTDALLALLRAELGLPVGITSRGPTAADKRELY